MRLIFSVLCILSLGWLVYRVHTITMDFKYNVGECYWHINSYSGKMIFKVVDQIYVKGEPHYVDLRLNMKYKYDEDLYMINSTSYIDKYHPSLTHEEKCKGLIDSAQKECIDNPNHIFTTGGIECPTKEEFFKLLKSKEWLDLKAELNK